VNYTDPTGKWSIKGIWKSIKRFFGFAEKEVLEKNNQALGEEKSNLEENPNHIRTMPCCKNNINLSTEKPDRLLFRCKHCAEPLMFIEDNYSIHQLSPAKNVNDNMIDALSREFDTDLSGLKPDDRDVQPMKDLKELEIKLYTTTDYGYTKKKCNELIKIAQNQGGEVAKEIDKINRTPTIIFTH